MPNMRMTVPDHAAYVSSAMAVTAYMKFFNDERRGESPCTIGGLVKHLRRLLVHLHDARRCRLCAGGSSFQPFEAEFCDVYRIFAALPQSKRLNGLRIEVLYSDAEEPRAITSPIAVFIAGLENRHGDVIAARFRQTMQEMNDNSRSTKPTRPGQDS
jgi:hypothetical protein